MYCVYCGVKLQDGAKECPLCRTPVTIAPASGTAEEALYSDRLPEKENRHGVTLVIWLLTAVMIAVCLGCLVFCLRTLGEAAWSGYVLMTAGLIWMTLMFPLLFRRYRPMIFLPISQFNVKETLNKFSNIHDKHLTYALVLLNSHTDHLLQYGLKLLFR